MRGRAAVWLVARREMRERIKQKSFLLSSMVTLLIVVAVAVVPSLFGSDGPDRYLLAAVNQPAQPVVDAARAAAPGFQARVDVKRYPNVAAARRALADDKLDALVGTRSIETRDEPDPQLEQLLQAASRRVVGVSTLQRAGVSAAAAKTALDPPALQVKPQKGADDDRDARSAFAFAAVLILYGQLLTFGFWVAAGVVEEKSSRVVEVVLATIKPAHLLAGKVIGLGLLGLAQLLVVAVVGVGAASAVGSLTLNGDIVFAALLAVVWFILGYAFYSCAFACAGALVSRQEELQSTTTPLTMVILVSFFVAFRVVQEPTGTLATVSSLVPMTAPMTMPPRIALGEAPLWEIVAAIVITAGSAAALIPLAGRIYRGAVLRTGSTVKLRDAWRSAERT